MSLALRCVLSVLAATLFLGGCKAKVETELSLNDILESETKTISSDLLVEVAACNSYEDSRQPSNSVIKSRENVPKIFAGATFVECFTKKFDAFAHFTIPVVLDKDKDGKLASESHLNIVSNSDVLLAVSIPRSIKANLERAKEASFGMDTLDLEIDIRINNDTGRDLPFKVFAAYVNGLPHVFSELTSKNMGSFTLTLSDVSVSSALDDGQALVLIR